MKTDKPKTLLLIVLGIALIAGLMLVAFACDDDETAEPTAEAPTTATGEPTAPEEPAELPGEGITVEPAKATWDTGWFQIEIYIKALEALGYKVEDPVMLENQAFYQAVKQGDVDFWANVWVMLHQPYLKDIEEETTIAGYVAKGGALQGYLIDKKTADEYGITNLDDFKNPDIAALFDTDGNGKANMVACPPGWGCELMIDFHLDAYELTDVIEPIKAEYSVSMADAIARYQQGESIFFYTWTPNWTVGKLIPGVDVVWIEVPFPALPEDQQEFLDMVLISGVEGCVNDPCMMGLVADDIAVIANNNFLADNPAAVALFDAMKIPLADIFVQNAKMFDGEDSPEDIVRHASEWVEENQTLFDSWIDAAMAAAE